MRVIRFPVLTAAVLIAAGCTDRHLTDPTTIPGNQPIAVHPALSANVVTLQWLPPMVRDPGPFEGAFDPNRNVVVRVVCAGAAAPQCPTLIEFTRQQAPPSRLSVDLNEEAYRALWHTPATLEVGDGKYRIEVREDQDLLAEADLWVVNTQREANAVPRGRIALVRGRPFLIKFRIEQASQSSQLPGAPADLAVAAITLEVSPSDGKNLAPGYPGLGTKRVSRNDATVRVAPNATVAEINAALAEFNARIIGGIPGVPGASVAVLVLRFATTSHAELAALLAALRQRAGIVGATPDIELGVDALPRLHSGNPALWEWSSLTQGGNWGLKRMSVPQLWNLNDLVERGGQRTETGVYDAGFHNHDDLTYVQNLTPADTSTHGTHVAGIIGATFDNGRGVDGVNPFADLRVQSAGDTLASWAEMMTRFVNRIQTYTGEQVINVSLGYNWSDAGINAGTSPDAQDVADGHGEDLASSLSWLQWLGRPLPVIVVSAGNDSNQQGWGWQPASFNSPWTNAALRQGAAPIIVVESSGANGDQLDLFSELGGHVSAPGTDVVSTVGGNGYGAKSGTSMAAPHITGLVSYLYALAPTLGRPTMTTNPIRDLLLQHGTTLQLGAPWINAFDVALDIDRVSGNDRVLRGLLDIDDGSVDGVLRIDANGFIVTGEDMDGDLFQGDGAIDMSDFRRFRDALIDYENAAGIPTGFGLMIDGGTSHAKRDLNRDGVVAPGSEGLWARVDFNGDGRISRSAQRAVAGALGGQMLTDLAVLQSRFSDPDYEAADLPDLLASADVSIDLSPCIQRSGAAAIFARIVARRIGTTDTVHQRLVLVNDPLQVVTVPLAPSGYNLNVAILEVDGVTPIVFDNVAAPAGLAQDSHLTPDCAVSVSVSPATRSMTPGQSGTFSALVLGAANTAVTWTATGGTITNDGVFTAGTTAGTFTVRATSVADPSASGTASVTISGGGGTPPPTPSVSMQIVTLFSGSKPLTPIRYRARVTNLPGVTVRWTFGAQGNGSGYVPNGPVSTVLFGESTPVNVDQYIVDWFAEVTYPTTWQSAFNTPGVTISVTACYFQANGQPLLRPSTGEPLCQSVLSYL